MVSHEQRKLERLNKIKSSIEAVEASGGKLNKDKLVAMCIMEWGTSRRTVLEYIKTVLDCR